MIRCPVGHCFSGSIESLTWNSTESHKPAPAGRRAAERKGRRPNTAPAYYLGHPADLWITAMRPRRRGSAFRHRARAALATTPLPTIWELAWAFHGTNDGPRMPASARDTMWLAWAAHDQWPWGGQ
jgi:hypothetical protein